MGGVRNFDTRVKSQHDAQWRVSNYRSRPITDFLMRVSKFCRRVTNVKTPIVFNSSLFINSSLSSLSSTSHAVHGGVSGHRGGVWPYGGGLGRGRGGRGGGGQGTFPSSCPILHYHMVLRPKGTSHNKPEQFRTRQPKRGGERVCPVAGGGVAGSDPWIRPASGTHYSRTLHTHFIVCHSQFDSQGKDTNDLGPSVTSHAIVRTTKEMFSAH